jgi:rhamnogalacturonan endolyase
MLFEGVWLFLLAQVVAAINLTESATNIVVSNERLVVSLTKSRGSIQGITLDGQDLLGPSGQGMWATYLYAPCSDF